MIIVSKNHEWFGGYSTKRRLAVEFLLNNPQFENCEIWAVDEEGECDLIAIFKVKLRPLYGAAINYQNKMIKYKIDWQGHFHLFLAALFPEMLFSERHNIIKTITPMLKK